ncbi:MAG: hypothetical protein B7C54_02920 [Acidimicrobiales bacterium mtb01]|nr:hypothetical protein [Actinomycetota bacterium]TEX47250.1 MAG: hypothetical protein B7C54_02920 [Acidimicrobiales bacterium mtb01]
MDGRNDSITSERSSILVATRVLVLALGSCAPLVSNRLETLDAAERLTVQSTIWATWAVVLLCVLVPSTVSLTALRLVSPFHLTLCVVLAVSNPDTGSLVAAVLSAIVVVLSLSAELGHVFVQTSAYGDERRILLRCPRAHLAVIVTMWSLWVASGIVGVSALVNRSWVFGGILTALAALGLPALPRRFHRYSRRWLVSVPAGIVVHDHVVLAETAMFARNSIDAAALVAESGESADLSGGTGRPWLEITLNDFDTVVRAATPSTPGGSAIHVKSFRIRPTRLTAAIDVLSS